MRKSMNLAISGVVVVLLATWWVTTAEAAMIRFRSPVTVAGAVVRLADVAEIQDADEILAARLGAVTIAPAPAAGRELRLDFESVRSRMSAQGINLSNLEFSGTSLVIISGAGESRDRSRPVGVSEPIQHRLEDLISKAVVRYVAERAPELGNLTVAVHLSSEQASAIASAVGQRFELAGGKAPWTGAQTFNVQFTDRQGKQREIPVACQVETLPRVLVLRFNVSRGHVLQADDVTWKQLGAPAEKDKVAGLNRLEAVMGQETKRALRAGEPITAQDIRGIPLIRRGDIVTVVSRLGGITVRMEAKAESEGTLGQPVKLVSLDRRRELVARVAGYHEAEITPATAGEE